MRAAHPYLLYASGVIGAAASVFGAFITFKNPWTPLFSSGTWRIWLALLCGVSALAAVVITRSASGRTAGSRSPNRS